MRIPHVRTTAASPTELTQIHPLHSKPTHHSFFHAYAFLCVSYGYAVLHVNYRGSTGFGADALAR